MANARSLFVMALLAIFPKADLTAQEASPPDMKLLVWYDLKEPALTFKHQAYDLRKKAFDEPAVRAWMEKMKADFPSYRVKLLQVRLADWPGSTEGERLLRAVQHEVGEAYPPIRRLERSAYRPIDLGPPSIANPPPIRSLPGRVPGAGASNPLGSTSRPPFPIPYPKPHP